MIIKSIRQGAAADRVVVTLETGEKIRMGKLLVSEFGLREGAELSEEEMAKLRAAVRTWSARDRAVRIVSASNVSKGSLRRKLIQKGEDKQEAEQAVAWLSDLELMDDRKTGEAIVRSAVGKGYGVNRIRQILREKEIPQEYWEDLLSDLPPMDDAVDRILRQRIRSEDPDRKEIQRAVDAALRQGHTWADIKAGLERLKAAEDLEEQQWQ